MPRVAAAAFRPAIYLSLSRRAAGRAVLAASPRHEPPDDSADIWWLPLTYDAATAATSTNPGQRRQHPHQVHRDVSNAFLRHVISHYTSEPVEALQFSRTEHGKPYLAGGLVKFNMSHADGLVGGTSMHSRSFPILLFPSLSFPFLPFPFLPPRLTRPNRSSPFSSVAVSQCEVGIDLELQDRRVRKVGNELRIARRYFTEAETAVIERASDDEARRRLFVRMWTLKEAYVKAICRGIGAPPGLSSFGFDLGATISSDEIRFCPGDNEPGRHDAWSFRLLEPVDGSLAALCLKRPGRRRGEEKEPIVASQRFSALDDVLEDLVKILPTVK